MTEHREVIQQAKTLGHDTTGHGAAHVHRDDEASKMGMWLFLFTELLLFGGLFLVLVFAAFMFNRVKITLKQKKIIEAARNEIAVQKETVEKQKELVEEKQKEILDSIRYAKRIQTALLTSEKYIGRKLKIINYKWGT